MLVTRDFTSKRAEIAAFNCPLTSSTSSPRTPVSKPYLTMDDLSRMFAGKSRPFDLQQHQNRCRSPQGFGLRQFDRHSTSSKKPYLTIENLAEMFDEKVKRIGLSQGQIKSSSRTSFSGQSPITAYFKPTVNQKSSIGQNSKSSKPKSLNQHMSAKSIRTASSESLPEKSAKLSYKMLDVSGETSSLIFILLRLFPVFLLALAIVSAVSAATMGCINVYEQAISAIGRAIS
ncbi:hypothetical protein G7Y79_00085g101100 [Physcia stellaris]|nr:hypothetical protein G7Y79_00085g101100 [Physcia stellaris]